MHVTHFKGWKCLYLIEWYTTCILLVLVQYCNGMATGYNVLIFFFFKKLHILCMYSMYFIVFLLNIHMATSSMETNILMFYGYLNMDHL